MNLIDVYLTEVGRQLPAKSRKDIQSELRSILEDMLEERSKQAGKPVDEELTLQVLQEYGSPEKVAASYQGERALIGPRLYPAFIQVLQIVLPIIGVLALVGLGFDLARTAPSTLSVLDVTSQAIGDFFGTLISALGSITLIFALLERFVPDLKAKPTAWEARSLLKIASPEKVKLGELIPEIVFSALGILVFNFMPQILGFTPSLNSLVENGSMQEVVFYPLFSETFYAYIPFLTGLWVLTIILDAILIQRGRMEAWSRWCLAGLKVLGIGIAAAMLVGPSLVALDVTTLMETGVHSVETATTLVTLVNQVVRLGLFLAILFGGVDLLKSILRIFRGKTPAVLVSSKRM